jgi:antitoxin component of MazEF toxin-antitoxin module
MIKTLSKHGGEWAVVIDQSTLDSLGIAEDTQLEILTVGESLVISPIRDQDRRQRFTAALEEVNQRFGNALRRLAE